MDPVTPPMIMRVIEFVQKLSRAPSERVLFHLLHVFYHVTDPDVFDALHPLVEANYRHLTPETFSLDFVEAFVTQFAATSYGHPTFASCVSLFLQMKFSVEIRRMIWSTPGVPDLLTGFPGVLDQCIERPEKDYAILQVFQGLSRKSLFSFQVAQYHLGCK